MCQNSDILLLFLDLRVIHKVLSVKTRSQLLDYLRELGPYVYNFSEMLLSIVLSFDLKGQYTQK